MFGGTNSVGGSIVYYSAVYSWNGSSWVSKGNLSSLREESASTRTSATEAQTAGGNSNVTFDSTQYYNGTTTSVATALNSGGARTKMFATSLGNNTFITGGGDLGGELGNTSVTNYRTGTGAFSTGPVWPFSGQATGLTNGDFTRAYALRHTYTNFAVYYTTSLNGAWTTTFNWTAWTNNHSTTVNGDMLCPQFGGNGSNIYRMTDAGVFTLLGTISAGANGYGIAGNGSGSQLSIVGGYNGTTGVNNHYTATYA
jgi:hypothetical protein